MEPTENSNSQLVKDCPPTRGHLAMYSGSFACHNWGRGCSWHLVGGDPTGHRTPPSTTTENYPGRYISSAEAEKPSSQ